MAVEKRARDLLVAVCVVAEHPGRQPDGCIRQGVADRLPVLGHLDEVAPPEDGRDRFECLGIFLLGPVREAGYCNPLEESRRYEPSEERTTHTRRAGSEQVE